MMLHCPDCKNKLTAEQAIHCGGCNQVVCASCYLEDKHDHDANGSPPKSAHRSIDQWYAHQADSSKVAT